MKETVIKKYLDRLNNLKEYNKESGESLTDQERHDLEARIRDHAEFVRDLKSLPTGEKYSLYKDLLNKDHILSHIFLNCLSPKDLEEIANENIGKTAEEVEAREIEISLIVNGKSINPKKFFDLFISQYDSFIKKNATEIVKEQTSEKLSEISNKIFEINEIMNSFAEDINWQVEGNPFAKVVKK